MRAPLALIALIAVVAFPGEPVRGVSEARSSRAAIQSTIAAPDSTSFFGVTPQFAIAPNGQDIVFVATAPGQAPALWLRSLTSTAARPLARTDLASYPFWSPDSQADVVQPRRNTDGDRRRAWPIHKRHVEP